MSGTNPQFADELQKPPFQMITLGLLGGAGGFADWFIKTARAPTTTTTTTITAEIRIHSFFRLGFAL
jgi:hypothetical protein